MMKIDALSFSFAGDKYLGTPYKEMDCQAFVEKCMQDCGLHMDLGGSNSWYRECRTNGWVGTPEECVKTFGEIPKGALLFILEPVSKTTPGKFRTDGIGDATHVGIKTGRNAGAIHSSSTKKCVAESEFHDRTIPNGGWNRVGLLDKFDYGKTVGWILDHIGLGNAADEKGEIPVGQTVARSENGGPINLRKTAGGDLLDYVPSGDTVEILVSGEPWSRVRWRNKTGWMMTKFLDEDPDPAPDPVEGTDMVTLTFTVDELTMVLPVLERAVEKIVEKVGRG